MATFHDCFAQASPGLERLVAAELTGLGIRPGRLETGGVGFRATTRQLYAANLWSRLASRILVRVASFTATSFADLERRAGELAWEDWLGRGKVAQFRVSSSRSTLYHTGAVAERLERVAGRHTPPAHRATGEQLFVARLVDDRLTLSLDASGDHLHRRGWRLDVGKAPLRESLAAAILVAIGWPAATPTDTDGNDGPPQVGLADPLCGSGTFLIEAALAARDRAPGLGRGFAFQHWPEFEPGTWASVQGEAKRRAAESAGRPLGPIVGADRDGGAVAAAQANAERAGVSDDVVIHQAPLSAFDPAEVAALGGAWLVTNPPYGERLGAGSHGDLRNLYATLGRLARSIGRAAILVGDPLLAGHCGLVLEERLQTTNGGLPVRLMVADPARAAAPSTGPRTSSRGRQSRSARPEARRDARRAAGHDGAADRPQPPTDRTG